MIDVDAENLPEQHASVLRIVELTVEPPAAVTDGDVQIRSAVGCERQHASVVILEGWVRDGQQNFLGRIGDVRIARRGCVFGDHLRAVASARVIHEEAAVERVVRVKCQAEQALLAAGGGDLGMDVEKQRRTR
jgi:hypothetical protein